MKVYIGVLITKNDKVLLIKEGKKSCYGKWNIPAGHLEETENLFNGAKREIKEETKLNVELNGIIGIYNNQFENSNSVSFMFSGKIDENEEIIIDGKEILEYKWFTQEEIKEMKEELRDYTYINSICERYFNNKIAPLDTIIIR